MTNAAPAVVPPKRPPFKPRKFGSVPVAKVNAAIGHNLAPGKAKLSAKAHEHIANDHPADYALVMRMLPAVLAAPDFVGFDGNDPNFYLVKEVLGLVGQPHVLVAISLTPDRDGYYRIKSGYCIKPTTVNNRLGATPPRLHPV